ncbi:DUF2637 domain-containing protein [Arthrobacter sp. STN4]|uniref:DUF2637 domain-containing protein n=1 Tax=Arthrobacter sp. STN4 TaxID=2923276 RepID=UPI00211A27E9|nr:DUF2637 domain-containing protein [Arthrobacter sp. STN4]MCQ9163002.1 DUF2637 domain-containing protein [Arthrobacter sp. STN4]
MMEPRKRAARILPDSPAFAGVVSVSVGVIFLAACLVSFSGQAEVAGTYLGLAGWQRYLIPLVVDVSLLIYAAAALVRRARGESARGVIIASGFWVMVSVAANVVHALQPTHILVGAVLAALMPIAILMASTVAESLLVAPPAVGEKLDREAALTVELTEAQAAVAESMAKADQLRNQIAKLEEAAKLAATATQPVTVEVKGSPRQKALAAVPVTATPAAERDVRIVELRASGETIPEISRQVGSSVSTVKRILAASAAPSAATSAA